MTLDIVLLTSVALAMDACAVAAGCALRVPRVSAARTLEMALVFGGFQAVMPVIGYFLGVAFTGVVASTAPWVAFALLVGLGGRMVWSAFQSPENSAEGSGRHEDAPSGWPTFTALLGLGVATSIDALAVGIGFGLLQVPLALAATVIGLVTFGLVLVAAHVGRKAGAALGRHAEWLGGAVLMAIGIRILVAHLLA
jgi:putative Mn2+ efflux pump MntP